MIVRSDNMDESVVKKKIQAAYSAPQASETLIQRTILRAQAVTMGAEAQRELETAPAEKLGQLASRVLIGQLAAVSDLPKGIKPEHLAQQLEQEPAFQAALRDGNAAQRVKSGELMRQVIKQKPAAAQASPKPPVQVKKGPGMGM
jgi:hypothetical protein